MENHLDCPLCQKKISFPGFHKHIFSSGHKDDLENLILKRKKPILEYLEGKNYLVMPYVIPNLKRSTTTLKLCYGCKKAFLSKSYFKNHTCPHLKEHLECLKKIVAKDLPVEVVPLTNTSPVAPSIDEAKLKSQIDRLKKELDLIKSDNDKLSGFQQMFINALKSYKQSISYDSFMEKFQDEESALYDSIIGDLEDEDN